MISNFQSIRKQVGDWLRTCQSRDDSSFVMSHEATEPTLMASSFAVLILELFDLLPDERSEEWISLFQSAQNPDTGLFIDPWLRAADLDRGSPGFDYLVYQTTYFAVAALDALRQRPYYSFKFALDLVPGNEVDKWLEGLDWSQPWAASNWVMFVATALYAEWRWYGKQTVLDALYSVLSWLDAHQDPETGFWGVTKGVPLSHAMAATYHFLPYYFCLGRELGHVDQMIESTLQLQTKDGLFHPDGGGDTCLDVDAVDILVKCSLLTSYRADDVEAALDRACSGLLANQSEDGGFCRALHRPLPPKSWRRRIGEALGLDRLLGRQYVVPRTIWNYSGWRAMPFDIREGDLWSTWFRPFGLAVISARYPEKCSGDNRWIFRSLPALGWHDVVIEDYQKSL
jgi:hypothetical protein